MPTKIDWDDWAEVDPVYGIVNVRDSSLERSADLSSLMESGVRDAAAALEALDSVGLRPARERALDFGCGVGRVTQALAGAFDTVVGLDVSERMIDLARKLNRAPNARFQANPAPQFPDVPAESIDFVFSLYVLQHNAAPDVVTILREFGRVLKPGGVAYFQVPHARRVRRSLTRVIRDALRIRTRAFRLLAIAGVPRRLLYRIGLRPHMRMTCMPQDAVVREMEEARLTVVTSLEELDAGPDFISYRYVVQRPTT